MQNGPWLVFLGLHVVMLVFTLGANALYEQDASWRVFVSGLPWSGGVDDITDAWEALSFNPISILALIFTTIKSVVLSLLGLMILNYALLNGEGWNGTVGLVIRAVAGVSGIIYGIQLLTQIRS